MKDKWQLRDVLEVVSFCNMQVYPINTRYPSQYAVLTPVTRIILPSQGPSLRHTCKVPAATRGPFALVFTGFRTGLWTSLGTLYVHHTS